MLSASHLQYVTPEEDRMLSFLIKSERFVLCTEFYSTVGTGYYTVGSIIVKLFVIYYYVVTNPVHLVRVQVRPFKLPRSCHWFSEIRTENFGSVEDKIPDPDKTDCSGGRRTRQQKKK